MKIGTYEIQVPFVTTSSDKLKTLKKLSDLAPSPTAVDLGSGDGRVALELAKWGFDTTGYEIKKELVERSKIRALNMGIEDKVFFFEKDFWNENLSSFSLIYIYGMNSIMGRLEKKLETEMKSDAILITNIFKLPHWKVKKMENNFYLYYKQ